MAISTSIKNYATPHKTGGGGGGGNTYVTNAGNHLIVGSTNAYDTTATNGLIYNIRGDKLDYNEGKFVDLNATNGNIEHIVGDTLQYNTGAINSLEADAIFSKAIGSTTNPVDELYVRKAEIEQILSKNITTDYLTVTKSAHFFELIIDKIKSVGGSIILSATNCTLDYATPITSGGNVTAYDVYWKAKDAAGRELDNEWWLNDQAICQSFNNVTQGTNYNVSSKYYWRLVTAINNDTYMWIGNENDPRNGTTETQANAQYNTVFFNDVFLVNDDNTTVDSWQITAQQGVTWTPDSQSTRCRGTLRTQNTIWGLELRPTPTTTSIVPAGILILNSNARISTTIYFRDGTSVFIPADSMPHASYFYTWDPSVTISSMTPTLLDYDAQTPVEKIVITNADEVLWTKVHSIRLGNVNTGPWASNPQYDGPSTDPSDPTYGYASVPARGDNLVQLGYRYFMTSDYDHKDRASAIMISAYRTKDSDLTPPSYAHYIGIDSFSLRSKRQTYFDATKAHFVGDFYVDANNTIQMNVYNTINNRTGINIEDGTITLDAANTYINGNLTLTSNDQGFVVKGPQGMAIMTPEQLGAYSTFLSSNTVDDNARLTAYSTAILNSNTNRYQTSFSFDYEIGNKTSGTEIKIKDHSATYAYTDISGTEHSVTASYGNSFTYQAYQKAGSSYVTASNTVTANGTNISGDVGTLTLTQTGNIVIRCTWSPEFSASSLTNYDGTGFKTSLSYTASYPIEGVYTKIACDGIGVKTDSSHTAYIGKNECYIDYGAQGGLHINGNVTEKKDPNGGGMWVPMSTMHVNRFSGDITSYDVKTYDAQSVGSFNDEVIIIDGDVDTSGRSQDLIINLPLPIERMSSSSGGWAGRVIYIKSYTKEGSNYHVKVRCQNGSFGYIMPSDQRSPVPDQNIGNYTRMYICDGYYWNEGHLSG